MALSYSFTAMSPERQTLQLVVCIVILCANALTQFSPTDNCFMAGLGKELEKRLASNNTETDLSAKKNTEDLSRQIIQLAAEFSATSRNQLQKEEKRKNLRLRKQKCNRGK